MPSYLRCAAPSPNAQTQKAENLKAIILALAEIDRAPRADLQVRMEHSGELA